MKKIWTVMALGILFAATAASFRLAEAAEPTDSAAGVRLRMSFEGGEVSVSLFDSPAARELVSMLPLELSFEDYARTEKVAWLPRKLTSGAPAASPAGDFAYYAPWGNLAVFYRGDGRGEGLYVLGKIESGKELLAGLDRNFTATIERH